MASFMQPQIYEGRYFTVDTSHGSEIVPCDVAGIYDDTTAETLQPYLQGKPQYADDKCVVDTGWLCRLSAPGYMDCTDWYVYKTEADAREAMAELQGCED